MKVRTPWYERDRWQWLARPLRFVVGTIVGVLLLLGGLALAAVEVPVLWLYNAADDQRTRVRGLHIASEGWRILFSWWRR